MYKNLKALREKKNDLVEKMTALSDKAANESLYRRRNAGI